MSERQPWRDKPLDKTQSLSTSSEHTAAESWQEALLFNMRDSFKDYKMAL